MTFREAVGSEAFDLFEAAFREVALVTVPGHAVDQLFPEFVDDAELAEGRHGATKLIGLARREAGRDDGDLHRLLLEQGDTQSAAQHFLQLLRREFDGLLLSAPPQIGMHHVPLDRARTHDRDLDHQVVEGLGQQAR